jgi:hypothetical protein
LAAAGDQYADFAGQLGSITFLGETDLRAVAGIRSALNATAGDHGNCKGVDDTTAPQALHVISTIGGFPVTCDVNPAFALQFGHCGQSPSTLKPRLVFTPKNEVPKRLSVSFGQANLNWMLAQSKCWTSSKWTAILVLVKHLPLH